MIYSFDEKIIPALSQVGGKAKALIETTEAGFPVPDGIALSVKFFETWLEKVKLSREIKRSLECPTRLNCEAVKDLVLSLCYTDKQKEALRNVVSSLEGDIFAVRSSSPEEDLKDNSFAGMYDTFLGITIDRLPEAIAKVFASCFDFRVMEYKKKNGKGFDNPGIAVIVQRQIASDVSGVGFSLNPLNNCYDEIVINAAFGLGEAIVSGIVTPDTYVVDWVKRKIIDKKVNEKKIALMLKKEGGTELRDNANPSQQVLSDKQIIELSTLIKKCEEYYGKPVDIEWAFEKGKLYLLQARPITTYLPFFSELLTEPGAKKRIYIDIMGMTQGFTEPMSVLGLEIWSTMLETVKGGIMSCSLEGTSPALHGRQYVNFSYFRKSLGVRMGDKMIRNYDGNIRKIFDSIDLDGEYTPRKVSESLKGAWGKIIKMMVAFLPGLIRAMFSDYHKVIDEYNIKANDIINKASKITAKEDFSVTVDKMMKEFYAIMNTAGVISVGVLALNSIRKMFKGMEAEKEFAALGMDLEGNPTSAMGHLMYKMACYDEFQATTTRDEFLTRIAQQSYSPEFLADYQEFMAKYAVRGFMEIDIATKRAYEDPGIIFDRLKQISIEDNQMARVKKKREAAYQRLLAAAKTKGLEKKFIRLAEKYQSTMGYREHPKYVIVYIFAMLHNVCLEIGEQFVSQRKLQDKWQIFDLHLNEINKAQKGESIDLLTAREKNLAPYQAVSHVKNWPLVIDSRGKIFQPNIEIKDGDIIGDPIAPGKVQGKAKVLHYPYEKPLEPGEILITTATEPSWTPIFTNAAGIVIEIGGPLQHGGIIAREYGIPCVSGLLGIIDLVKDGDLLEVDGSNGVVRIIQE